MRRIHFFEILDQAWCPKAVREGALEAITSSANMYRSVREPMMSAIRISGATRVVDLCSGGFAIQAGAASPPFVVARRPNFRSIERKT